MMAFVSGIQSKDSRSTGITTSAVSVSSTALIPNGVVVAFLGYLVCSAIYQGLSLHVYAVLFGEYQISFAEASLGHRARINRIPHVMLDIPTR